MPQRKAAGGVANTYKGGAAMVDATRAAATESEPCLSVEEARNCFWAIVEESVQAARGIVDQADIKSLGVAFGVRSEDLAWAIRVLIANKVSPTGTSDRERSRSYLTSVLGTARGRNADLTACTREGTTNR